MTMSPFPPMHNDDQQQEHAERLAVVQDRVDRRNEGVWIRWAAGVLVVGAVGSLSTVMELKSEVSVLKTQMQDDRAASQAERSLAQVQRAEMNGNMREHTATDAALKDAVVGLTMKVDILLEERQNVIRKRGPVFPDGSGRFDK